MKCKALLAAAALALAPSLAFAAGAYTNGAPAATFPLTGNETIPADTNLSAGQNPQFEAVNPGQLAAYSRPLSTITYAATITPDYSVSGLFKVTLTGNVTIANPVNLINGATWRIEIVQDATGSRTVALGTTYKWAGGTAPTWSIGASKVDVMTCTWDGTTNICSALIDVR